MEKTLLIQRLRNKKLIGEKKLTKRYVFLGDKINDMPKVLDVLTNCNSHHQQHIIVCTPIHSGTAS